MFLNVRVLHIWLHIKLSPKGRQKKSVQRKKDMRRNEWDLLLTVLKMDINPKFNDPQKVI